MSDPLFRLASRAAERVRGSATVRRGHREVGEWEKDEAELREPRRTERLLANFFTLRHETAADALQGMERNLLSGASGGSSSAVLFAWLSVRRGPAAVPVPVRPRRRPSDMRLVLVARGTDGGAGARRRSARPAGSTRLEALHSCYVHARWRLPTSLNVQLQRRPYDHAASSIHRASRTCGARRCASGCSRVSVLTSLQAAAQPTRR